MTPKQKVELDGLKAKLEAREGKPGFAANAEAIKARIKELENGN